MHPQTHRSDPRILGRRTLREDHRYLAQILQPGLSVLDVGCGTGAITAGIAQAVGPEGFVVGVDRDAGHLEIARTTQAALPNLHFEQADATSLSFSRQFDIVTAARTLQWISQPELAILHMKEASRPGGRLVVLDYNHARNQWRPDPPAFRHFYDAFLAWRAANHWDNHMADHLPALFRSAGLAEIESHIQDETVERGQPGFADRAFLWSEVIDNVGEQLIQNGFSNDAQLREASASYRSWVQTDLERQTLSMRTVVGRVP